MPSKSAEFQQYGLRDKRDVKQHLKPTVNKICGKPVSARTKGEQKLKQAYAMQSSNLKKNSFVCPLKRKGAKKKVKGHKRASDRWKRTDRPHREAIANKNKHYSDMPAVH